jgi:hypothetical protein
LLFSTATSSGEEKKFKPGEIVLVPMYGKLEEAQVVSQDASGVLVRQKDWQDGSYKPDGSTRHYTIDKVAKKALPAAAPGTAPAGLGVIKPPVDTAAKAAAIPGDEPLTKEQVLAFVRERVGTDGPHPMREKTCAELRDLIKKRGVDFKPAATLISELHQAGGDMSVYYVLQANVGRPPELKWFLDEWDVWLTTRPGFAPSLENGAKFGFVAIEADHKYLWKVGADDPPAKWIDGKWREATAEELKYYGGAGIVLLKGEQGEDWIVHKDDNAPRDQEWINIAQLESRQIRRGGKRAPAESNDTKK